MALRTVPFSSWHLMDLGEIDFPGDYSRFLETQNSWTLLDTEEIQVVGCGGTICHWPGRHTAWFLHGDRAPAHMLRLTRLAKLILQDVPGRIEATAEADFEPGKRWLEMLGFKVETPLMREYRPGEDHVGYVRIQCPSHQQ